MSDKIHFSRTIEVYNTAGYAFRVNSADEFYLEYLESNEVKKEIFFGSKAEMKAVALAMLELAEKE